MPSGLLRFYGRSTGVSRCLSCGGGCRAHIMSGGVLHGEGLHGGVSIQERAHLRRNFREDSVVVVIDVSTILPKRRAGELSRVGIKSFDVVHETRLRLNLRQKRVVQQGAKFRDLGWCDSASDNASDHELPPLASKIRTSRGGGWCSGAWCNGNASAAGAPGQEYFLH